ncbi:MAG: transglycosylase domain-containing protein [Lachnospiraceae bacterium]|nr:transglycosylase domain-containing protein [Lachnospiraceae bacterium]
MNYGKQGIHKQQVALNARGKKWSNKLLLVLVELLIVAVIGVGIVGAAFGIGMFKSLLSTAPDISTITVTPKGLSTFVYDSDGNQIAKLVAANANRIPVTLDRVPKHLQQAVVAIEDERFYTHNGIDIRRIMSLGVKAVLRGSLNGGGASTITQQLLKNNVFTDWMSETNNIQKLRRKVQEQYLAVQLEKSMSKDEILNVYLNTINLGHNTLGVQTASLRYFGKDVSELTLSESTVLAVITNNPSLFDPIVYPENNAERRVLCLNKMVELGYITDEERQACLKDNVYDRISENNIENGEAQVTSYFVDALTDDVIEDLKAAGYNDSQVSALLYSGGLKIYSTMDSRIQKICDEEFSNPENYPENTKWLLNYRLSIRKADGTMDHHSSEMFRSYFRKKNSKFNMLFKDEESAKEAVEEYKAAVLEEGDEVAAETFSVTPQPQVSFTLSDQKTGYVLAMVGGRGTKEGSRTFNRATQSTRQPGSCFKVLSAFAPALDSADMTLATVFNDAPFNYYNGTPVSNWYGKDTYKGLCSIRYGIYWSLNVVAVKTITQITPQLGFNYLQNFGFTTLEESKVVGDKIYTDIGQPLALGGITNGILNIELNAAYASIANGGVYIKPKLYTKIEDSNGNILIDNTAPVTRRTVSEETAWLLTDAMKDCVTIGTGTRARFKDMSIAGKTGTTSDSKDLWFAGYTPYYTATCWSGYDNNETMTDIEARIPQTMFKAVMQRVHEGLEDIGFPKPDTIKAVTVCSQSGLLPREGYCDACRKTEYFAAGTEPTEYCNVHYHGMICAYDNLPATENCPFAYEGTTVVAPVEDPSLWQGSEVIVASDDPLATPTSQADLLDLPVKPNNKGHCQHDEEFYMQPAWEAKIEQQRAELWLKGMIFDPNAAATEEGAEGAAVPAPGE